MSIGSLFALPVHTLNSFSLSIPPVLEVRVLFVVLRFVPLYVSSLLVAGADYFVRPCTVVCGFSQGCLLLIFVCAYLYLSGMFSMENFENYTLLHLPFCVLLSFCKTSCKCWLP